LHLTEQIGFVYVRA